jgi:hypothetical protein
MPCCLQALLRGPLDLGESLSEDAMLFATVNQVSANKCVARHDGYDDEADNEGMAASHR